MVKFLSAFSVAFIIFTIQACSNPGNPLSGKWKSLVQIKAFKSLDFSLTFENNNTFHAAAEGAGQTLTISGGYSVQDDTLIISDRQDQPQQCNYSDTGKYIFADHGDTMFFKTIKDNCEKRKLTFEIGLVKAR